LPANHYAFVIFFAGRDASLQISQDGTFKWSEGNFLIRIRWLFAHRGLAVAVVDSPSDHQSAPFFGGFASNRKMLPT
jgi:hypothetical protein